MTADAQLLALVAKLEPIYAEYQALAPIVDAAVERREEEIARRIGIPAGVGSRSEDEAMLYRNTLKRLDAEMGTDALLKRLDAINLRLDTIVTAIKETPARTLAGVAVKARGVAYAMRTCWQTLAEELDWHEDLVRDLVENICAIAGMDLPRIGAAAAADAAKLN
jgi:hypothetical protein